MNDYHYKKAKMLNRKRKNKNSEKKMQSNHRNPKKKLAFDLTWKIYEALYTNAYALFVLLGKSHAAGWTLPCALHNAPTVSSSLHATRQRVPTLSAAAICISDRW